MQQRKGCLPAFIYTVLILGLFIAGIGLSQCRNDTEARFSGSSQPGDAVYGDIVSIVPQQFLDASGGGYGAFVCSAESPEGKILWIYISTDSYTRFIDPYGLTTGTNFRQVTFDAALRIHGNVVKAENIAEGLSQVTGATILAFSHID